MLREVIALEGNGARPSHMGKGFSEDGRMFTLNTIERHVVCFAIDSHPEDSRFRIEGGAAPTLTRKISKGSADGPLVLLTCDTRGHVHGGGGTTPTMTGDHNGHISDYTTIVVIRNESISNENRSLMCEQPSR